MMTNLEDAYYISGGTKIMPRINQGRITPKHLISLDNMADLKSITKLNGVRLGSGLTLTQVKENDLVQNQYTALYDAICSLSLSKKEERGTLGGDLCSAYPFALMACPTLLFDTEVAAAGMYPATHPEGMGVKGGFFGSRIIRIDSFFATRDSTILKKDELVKEFILPFLPDHTGSAFIKIKRGKSAYLGITGIGARITVSSQDRFAASRKVLGEKGDLIGILDRFAEGNLACKDVRLVVAHSRNLPRRLRSGEDELNGNILSGTVFKKAIQSAMVETMNDIKGKTEPWYLQEMVKVLLMRTIMKAIDRGIRPEEKIRPEVAF
jgi:carbon-monoxide dehydrogenase medium subunit